MFENRDYIALSVSDDSVRKKSLKRVSFDGGKNIPEVTHHPYLRGHSSSSVAMEPAIEVSEEPRNRGCLRLHLHDFHLDTRSAENGWTLQLVDSFFVSTRTYQHKDQDCADETFCKSSTPVSFCVL